MRSTLQTRNFFVGGTEFKAINWLPTKHKVDQNICVKIMKIFNGTAPAYADEIFHPADQPRAVAVGGAGGVAPPWPYLSWQIK